MNRRRLFFSAFCLGGCGIIFLLIPAAVGAKGIGGRDGPAFYPQELHEVLYILGHEAATGVKPRMSLTWELYDRPLFWGLPRRPKSEELRNDILKKMAERPAGRASGFYKSLSTENERINTLQKQSSK